MHDLTDHLPNFIIFNKFSTLPYNVKIFKRGYSEFDQQALVSEIQLTMTGNLFLFPVPVHAICLNHFTQKFLA